MGERINPLIWYSAYDLLLRSKHISDILITGLKQITVSTDKIKEIRSRELMVAIELKDNTIADLTT